MTQPDHQARRDVPYIPVNIALIQRIMQKGKPYKLNTAQVDNITLVAKVTSYHSEGGGSIDLSLEDDTGKINGKIFKRNGSNTIKPILNYDPRVDEYASIIGTLMNFNGVDLIIVTRMQNVTEYAIVNLHRIQIFWAFLIRNSVMHLNPAQMAGSDLTMKFNEQPIENSTPTEKILSFSTYSHEKSHSNRLEDEHEEELNLLNSDQRKVYEYCKANKLSGVSQQELTKKLGMNSSKVQEVLNQLDETGYLYSDSVNYFVT